MLHFSNSLVLQESGLPKIKPPPKQVYFGICVKERIKIVGNHHNKLNLIMLTWNVLLILESKQSRFTIQIKRIAQNNTKCDIVCVGFLCSQKWPSEKSSILWLINAHKIKSFKILNCEFIKWICFGSYKPISLHKTNIVVQKSIWPNRFSLHKCHNF